MYTQNTPVHVKLWHHDFWRLAIANMLLTMSVYMQIPVLPLWLAQHGDAMSTGLSMGAYGLGLFVMGGCCNYLVQRYRRNHVCQLAILMMLACIAVIYLTVCGQLLMLAEGMVALVARFCLGASFGLAQMVLVSTLIIDVCESFQRTEANHSAAWFGRFSMSLGPVAALLIYRYFSLEYVLLSSGVCCLLSMVPAFRMAVVRELATDSNHHRTASFYSFVKHVLRDDDVRILLRTAGRTVRLCECRPEERVGYRTDLDYRCVADDATVICSGEQLYPASAHRLCHWYYRLAFPAVLHQAEQTLSARYFTEYVLLSMGNGHQLRTFPGLLLSF